jgi:F-type H+-transporting ATPase subunit b
MMLLADSSGFGALFEALGLNLQSFLLNTAAFLVVVAVLAKWVFPPLTKALDAKRDELEAALRLENEASVKLAEAEKTAGGVVAEARTAAGLVLADAKTEAGALVEAARAKAEAQAERLVTEACEQLARDVAAARVELRGETARLVASATETVLGKKLDAAADAELVTRSLETK